MNETKREQHIPVCRNCGFGDIMILCHICQQWLCHTCYWSGAHQQWDEQIKSAKPRTKRKAK